MMTQKPTTTMRPTRMPLTKAPRSFWRMTALAVAVMATTSMAHAQDSNLSENTNPEIQQGINLEDLPTDMELLFPLTPEERLEIRQRQLQDQEATYKPLRTVTPKRELVSISGNADTIPEVLVTPDYPTSIVFTDITGAPWPINYIGQTSSLAQVEQPSGTENAVVVYANNGAGRKSVSVFLKGMTLPVTLTVAGTNNEYHALKHIRITERGPNAPKDNLMPSGPSNMATALNPTGNDDGKDMDAILNKLAYKVTPDGFKKLKTSDPSVDAWMDKDDPKHLYVMTKYTMVSPAPRAGARSVTPLQDGVRIYVVPRINPMMALDDGGQRIYLTFKE